MSKSIEWLFTQKYGTYELSVSQLVQKFAFDKALCSFGCYASFCRMVCVER